MKFEKAYFIVLPAMEAEPWQGLNIVVYFVTSKLDSIPFIIEI